MTSKWSTISFFGLGALLTAGMAAVGCSVSTTGIVDDDGGTGTPIDSSTGTDASTLACPGNTHQSPGLFPTECQSQLNANCCTELEACFGVTPTDTTKRYDCNALVACVDRCNYKADGTTACTTDADCTTTDSACLTEPDNTKKCHDLETDMAAFDACEGDCKFLAQADIGTAFDNLNTCIKNDTATANACGTAQ